MTPTKTVINITQERRRFEIATVAGSPSVVYDLEPGGTAEVAAGYTILRNHANPDNSDARSIIEQLTDGAVVPMASAKAKQYIENTAAKAERKAAAAKGEK
jgi:hypothetical protein